MIRRTWLAAATLTTLVVSGCGGSENASPTSTADASTQTSTAQATPAGLEIDISIADGAVTPTNATYDTTVGQPIVLNVDSDADDELHVHSEPEHTFEVKSGEDQKFEFTVEIPGRVDVELHHLGRTVATIAVGA